MWLVISLNCNITFLSFQVSCPIGYIIALERHFFDDYKVSKTSFPADESQLIKMIPRRFLPRKEEKGTLYIYVYENK